MNQTVPIEPPKTSASWLDSPLIIWAMVLGFTGLRLAAAPWFGLGVDEAHYVLYAHFLDLSYFDHPPLVGWVHAPFYYLSPGGEFWARVPAILVFVLTTWLMYRLLRQALGPNAGLWPPLLALSSGFMFNALALMFLPDSLLMPLGLLTILTLRRLEGEGSTQNFVLLGVVLGLAGLAKYTAIMLVPPVLIYLALKRRWDLLLNKNILYTALAALVLISPVIIWNLLHDMASFKYQSSRVMGGEGMRVKSLLESWGAQFGAYSPFVFPLAFYGAWRALISRNDLQRLMLLMGGTMFLFFSYTALYETVLPHWNCFFYLLFIPLGVFWGWNHAKRWFRIYTKAAVYVTLGIILLAYAEVSFKFLPLPDYKSLHRDILGWDEIMAKASEIAEENPSDKKGYAVTNWTLGSRAIYYSRGGKVPVYVIDKKTTQFDFWQKGSPLGRDLLFLNTHFFGERVADYVKCGSIEPAGEIEIKLGSRKVNQVRYTWCRDYQGLKNP